MEYRSIKSNDTNHLSHGLQGKELLNDIYLDLFLNHVHAEQYEEYYMQKIDEALDTRDEELFMQLTTELNALRASV
ncbi:IDEAL domain-containing protein [Kurthia huakuii]|uniref:IDEAL domain-containing protein n=1 Tax=Kurthia huakuii TaxID=1421019 RepID=UPI000495151B|nr:IDEAL domain-containing protein [Kurthia huakuii]MBM7700764.1 uncharacterized protein YpiB (UPF0302 family) [Kurthia huakuii]